MDAGVKRKFTDAEKSVIIADVMPSSTKDGISVQGIRDAVSEKYCVTVGVTLVDSQIRRMIRSDELDFYVVDRILVYRKLREESNPCQQK